jgi:hypothetical protein
LKFAEAVDLGLAHVCYHGNTNWVTV